MAIREVTIDKQPDARAALSLIQGESRAQVVRFVIDRYEGGVDLSGLSWCVRAVNARGESDVYALGTAEASGNSLTVDWLVHGVATAVAGETKFALEGAAEADGPVVWRNGTRVLKVYEALDAEPSADEEQLTALQQLIVYVSNELDGVVAAGQAAEKAAADADAARARAEAAADAANEVKADVQQLKDEKLDRTPGTWPAWTADEQARARQNISAASAADMEAAITYTDNENAKVRQYINDKLWTMPTDPYWADVVSRSLAERGTQYYGMPVLALYGSLEGMSKESAVTLDFAFGRHSGKAKVKWQGSSSLSYEKKNYALTLQNADGSALAFQAAEGWGARDKYVAKANWIDATHLRNVVCARLWGQMVSSRKHMDPRLAASPNYGAIDGFPILITHNPEPASTATYAGTRIMGLYTLTLPKKGFLMGMGDGERECILSAEKPIDTDYNPGVFFWENPTIGYDFSVEYPGETPEWAQTALTALYNAFPADGSWNEELENLVDWESVIDYMIFVVLITGTDMIGKNYLLSTYDGAKWFFGAYDMDTTFGLAFDGGSFEPMDSSGTTFDGLWRAHRIFRFALDFKREALVARYRELRGGVLSVDSVATAFREFAKRIPAPVYDLERAIWPGVPSSGANTIDGIIAQYARKCAAADMELGVDEISELRRALAELRLLVESGGGGGGSGTETEALTAGDIDSMNVAELEDKLVSEVEA